MKRRIVLSIALVMGVVSLSLMTSTADAQSRGWVADSGMVTLGPDQAFRIIVSPATSRNRSLTVSFNAQFTTVTCSGGVCTHTVTSETMTAPVTLMPGQAASYDINQPTGASAVRGRVFADSPDMQVDGLFVDTNTGRTTSRGDFVLIVCTETGCRPVG